MKLRLIIGVIVVILLVSLGVLFVNVASNNFQIPFITSHPKSTVTIDGHTFYVTVANTEKEKETGLSTLTSLPQDQGMLFPFGTPAFYAFWMRNMKFPIDIIFIANKKILTIFPNVPAPKDASSSLPIYKPNQPADTVLEINAGISQKYHFSIGDTVSTSL